MDSINKEQPEDNMKDLGGTGAIDKIKELAGKASCFFCTNIQSGRAFATRPMAVQEVDDAGNMWFLSADDSHKNAELQADASVQILFQASPYSDFLTLYGKATVTKDKSRIKELWNPILKNWFTDGEDDPRITVIKVTPEDGYYWDNKHGNAVAFAKTIVGAITGQTLDDSIEGKVSI